MRDLLVPHLGTWGEYRATVGVIIPTDTRPLMVLTDVMDRTTGLIVADHLWVRQTDSLRAARTAVGERFNFRAKVLRYTRKDGGIDYGLGEVRVDDADQRTRAGDDPAARPRLGDPARLAGE